MRGHLPKYSIPLTLNPAAICSDIVSLATTVPTVGAGLPDLTPTMMPAE